MSTHRLQIGDRIIETTPSGRKRHLVVAELDAPVKYPRPDERYVRLDERGGPGHTLAESAVFDEDWLGLVDGKP